MIAIDTNLLVYAHRAGTAEHKAARKAMETASANRRGWGIASPCLWEFWRVVTHAASPGRPSKPEQAAGFLSALMAAGAVVFYPREGFAERLLREACRRELAGGRILDLQISLMAKEAGATRIWTHDARFVSVAGVRVEDPL